MNGHTDEHPGQSGKPPCWLCADLGGVAVRMDATTWLKDKMFEAGEIDTAEEAPQLYGPHKLQSDTHAVEPCPNCEVERLREAIKKHRRNSLGAYGPNVDFPMDEELYLMLEAAP